MGIPESETFLAAGAAPRTRISLLLESIALRHQIAVLERSRTRRPCFRLWDRLFWILFARWWPQWREGLVIVQPETVLRWRRSGWSAMSRYRARGRWRGGRPRVSGEIRGLIAQMARENFLWGAPRIHGELLMLGFSVSQATVSRYLLPRSRRRDNRGGLFFATKPWRSVTASITRNGRGETLTYRVSPLGPSSSDPRLRRLRQRYGLGSGVALSDHSPVLNNRRIRRRSDQCERGVTHRAASVSGSSRRALCNRRGAAS
jgi:hypothetical protein